MRPFDKMHIAPADLINWQAVIDVQYSIGMGLEPAGLHALLAQLAGLGSVRGDQQQIAVRLAEYMALVATQVDEEQPWLARRGRHGAELHAVLIDTVHLKPGVDMQPRAAAKPGFAQLRVSVRECVRLREQHIVNLDAGPWVTPTEHDDIQQEQFLSKTRGAEIPVQKTLHVQYLQDTEPVEQAQTVVVVRGGGYSMNLNRLTELLHSGAVEELELLSLEGGFYILRALTATGPQTLSDSHGQPMRLRSTTELRHLLEGLPTVPCMLVQHVVHDEMCGQRDGPVAPLRVPVGLASPW